MADTNAFWFFLLVACIWGFGMMFIYWVYSAYKEHKESRELKEYKKRAEEERQAAKIATILGLTNDIWTDIKNFKVNQK